MVEPTAVDVAAYLAVVGRAEAIARVAHEGQTDLAGFPYVEHVARVARTVEVTYGADGETTAAAWLHDVLEDTTLTVEGLHRMGVPPRVVDAVVALTHPRGEPLTVYWERVRADPVARRVKLADVADNADPARLARLGEPLRSRLTGKYARAHEALQSSDETPA